MTNKDSRSTDCAFLYLDSGGFLPATTFLRHPLPQGFSESSLHYAFRCGNQELTLNCLGYLKDNRNALSHPVGIESLRSKAALSPDALQAITR